MSSVRLLVNLIVALVLATAMAAQEATGAPGVEATQSNRGDTPSSAADSQSDASQASVSIPREIEGSTYSGGAQERANLVSGGFSLGTAYDDNVLNRSNDPLGDVQYMISPNFALSVLRSHTLWTLKYAGGMTLNQRVGEVNVTTHDFAGTVEQSLSRHVVLSARLSYLVTTNPFSGTMSLKDTHVPAEGQTSPILPIVSISALDVDANLSWQTGPHSVFGISGSSSRLRFGGDESLTLVPTNSYDARVYYGRALTSHTTIGITTVFQDFTFPTQSASTRALAVQYFQSVELSKVLTLSFFGGPQHSNSRDPLVQGGSVDKWYPSGGFTLGWNGSRVAIELGLSQAADHSGGLTHAVHERAAHLGVLFRLARNWSLGVNGCVARSVSLESTSSSLNDYRTLTAGTALSYRLRKNVGMILAYQHAHQLQGAIDPLNPVVRRNRVEMGISYQFVRPWGR